METMKFASLLAKFFSHDPTMLPARETFHYATKTAADIFRLGSWEIKVGNRPDIILIDLARPEFVPNFDIYSDIVYATNSHAVDTVICMGSVLMEERQVPGEEEIMNKVRDFGEGLCHAMRFICDSTLGKLTKYLRMLGLDTVLVRNPDALTTYKDLADLPLLFTKKEGPIAYHPIIRIKTDRVDEQIREIENVIGPYVNSELFMTRCLECNTILQHTDKEDIETRIPEYIYHHHEQFKICPSCRRVYWEGTHTERMKKWVAARSRSDDGNKT